MNDESLNVPVSIRLNDETRRKLRDIQDHYKMNNTTHCINVMVSQLHTALFYKGAANND